MPFSPMPGRRVSFDPKSPSDCGNTCHTVVKAKDYIFHHTRCVDLHLSTASRHNERDLTEIRAEVGKAAQRVYRDSALASLRDCKRICRNSHLWAGAGRHEIAVAARRGIS
jgi:hypothetical protein